MAISENSKKLITFLQANNGEDFTAQDVADALGFEKKNKVDGAFTSAIQRKGLGFREEAEIELADGTHQKVKFLKLNDAGMAFDVNATEE